MLDPDESEVSGMEKLAVSTASPGEEGDEGTDLRTARIEAPLGDDTDEEWQQPEAASRSPAVPIRSSGRQRTDDLDQLDESVLQEMLLKASPKFTQPFDVSQITRNLSAARAARREMDGFSSGGEGLQAGPLLSNGYPASDGGATSSGSPNGTRSVATSVTGYAGSQGGMGPLLAGPLGSVSSLGTSHSLAAAAVAPCFGGEIARQRAAVAAAEDDVAEESRVNRELAEGIVARLDNSCKMLEGLSQLLSALGAAEGAYASAMAAAASRVRQAVAAGLDADDGEVRAAGEALMRLPSVVELAHRPLQATLSGLASDVSGLLGRYRAAARAVSGEVATAQRHIDTTRQQLAAALAEHVAACRAMEGVLGERARGRPTRAPDADPWATEGRLVLEQQTLQQWQDKERTALKAGFQQVTELEQQRLQLAKQAMTSAVDSYRAACLPLQHDLEALTHVLRSIQPDAKLSSLRAMADTASRTAEGLAARQAECLHSVCHELFCSPEITRQGDLQLWEPAYERWRKCHFVLTRAGYLRWFPRAEDVRPLDCLALARCAFEAGKAPRFHITEAPARGSGWLSSVRGRKLMFQAGSVEECCDWAIAIREAIAVATGKALAYDDEEQG